jgi:hypothetical protein
MCVNHVIFFDYCTHLHGIRYSPYHVTLIWPNLHVNVRVHVHLHTRARTHAHKQPISNGFSTFQDVCGKL